MFWQYSVVKFVYNKYIFNSHCHAIVNMQCMQVKLCDLYLR